MPNVTALHRSSVPAAVPAGWRQGLWLALLVLASVAFSLGFTCAVPFAAFGAAAALTLGRGAAMRLMIAVWLANQLVGFGLLDYPWTANSIAWGAVLGVVAVLCAEVARAAAVRLRGRSLAVLAPAAFLAAFAAYEGGLFLVAASVLGGTEDFTPAIVARIFVINLCAWAGLLALARLAAAAGLAAWPAPLVAAPRRA